MISETTTITTNIWSQLETAIDSNRHPRNSGAALDIWSLVDDQFNPLQYRPRKKDAIELATIDEKNGAVSYMLRNPENDRYLILAEKDLFLWNLMDENRSVKDLYLELSMEYGLVPQTTIFSLIEVLKNNGFLQDRQALVYQAIDDKLRKHQFLYRIKKISDFFLHARFTTKKADRFFSWLYSKLAFVFRKSAFYILFAFLALDLGLTAYFVFFMHETMLLTPEVGAGSHDIICMIIIIYLSVVVHETAHGLAVKHYQRKVLQAGVMLLFGSPIAYVDTTDILMRGRFPRIGVSFAGPCINGVLGGILLLFALIVPESIHENLAIQAGLINSLMFVINLIPFTETDGHYIIQDWLVQPQLRKESLEFLRRGGWKKLRSREKWQKKEFGYLIYSSISVFGICYLLVKGIHLWLFTGKFLLQEALSNPHMLLEVLSFWLFFVFLIALFRFIIYRNRRKFSIPYLLAARLDER